MPLIDWQDAFANGAYIPGSADLPARWADQAAAFRATARQEQITYGGDTDRMVMDLFHPDATPRGVVVFVHGGYWIDFDKSSWSHLAAGPLARGFAVAMPSYDLAPQVTIPQITAQVARAITAAAQRIAGPIHLAGHSAGGHLVARMLCPGVLPVVDRVAQVVSISGLHDLRPLIHHSDNAKWRLDEATARAESPALIDPIPGAPLTAWVGALERPEFLRQAALIREAWDAQIVVDPGRHHFDVIDALADPDSALSRLVCTAPTSSRAS